MRRNVSRLFVVFALAVSTIGCASMASGRILPGSIPTPNDVVRSVVYGSNQVASLQDSVMEITCQGPGKFWMPGLGPLGCLQSYQLAGNQGWGWGRQQNGQVAIYADQNRNPCPSPIFMGLAGALLTSLITDSPKGVVIGGLASGGGCAAINAIASHTRNNQNVQQRTLPDGRQIPIITTYVGGTGATSAAPPSPIQEVPPSRMETEEVCKRSGGMPVRNDTGVKVRATSTAMVEIIEFEAGGSACVPYKEGAQMNFQRINFYGTGRIDGQLTMNDTPVCLQKDSRQVVHLRNTCQ